MMTNEQIKEKSMEFYFERIKSGMAGDAIPSTIDFALSLKENEVKQAIINNLLK